MSTNSEIPPTVGGLFELSLLMVMRAVCQQSHRRALVGFAACEQLLATNYQPLSWIALQDLLYLRVRLVHRVLRGQFTAVCSRQKYPKNVFYFVPQRCTRTRL